MIEADYYHFPSVSGSGQVVIIVIAASGADLRQKWRSSADSKYSAAENLHASQYAHGCTCVIDINGTGRVLCHA